MTTFFLNRLATEPHAFAFAGQSTPWPVALADQTTDPSLDEALRGHVAAAGRLLTPVAADLLATTGRPVDLFGFAPNPARLGAAADATASVEGVALTQLGALLDLEHLGYSVAQAKPLAVLGHSQGVLAVHMTRAIEAAGSIEAAGKTLNEILAVAALIGAAGTRRVRELGLNPKYGEASPMLSVKGATREQVEALVARVNNARGPISIAVTNSDNHHVLSGYPEDLAAFALEAEREHQHQAKLREQKLHGGTVFNPTLEYLEVTLPFHSPLMADAVEQTVAWAGACGFDQKRTRALAEEVLLNHVDWNARVKALFDAADPSKLWIVDLGPGNTLGKLIGNVVQGTGIGVVEATTLAERSTLSTLESEPERTQNWKAFAPRVINTPAGAKLVTKFSKLTGKPPVLLPGMTPTTVEPEIVAAAANAGYWAELAGGGQVTVEVFDRHIAALEDALEEGRTVEFNAMFMDRYLWNLQFGSSRIVPKKRASGAPIDGVVVSAGIPELDEAVALIKSLQADGLPYVSFKPGTVDQIRQVVRIAKAVAPTTIMVQVEGGEAGGHHSWEALDDLLAATYAEVRACDNLVLVAGGGIGTPERAADYISGQWAHAYGLPDMPVDGVLIGTAAMTAKEAHTSPEVKQLLVKTPGIPADAKSDDVFAPQAAHWVPSGKSVGGMSSGLSHLHADIYELENDSAECGRLLVRVMKHPEELDSRRKEIIEALNKTAKPYFGDLASMTYLEWAQRFAELAFPWVDPTYADRFQHLLQRIEARVNDTDSGEFTSKLFAADGVSAEEAAAAGLLTHDDILADPAPALEKLALAYPQTAELKVVPTDVAWFPVLVREYPKPMPFVPVIDNDLLRWWGQDQLWQSEDQRYSADSVRAIPGPISVAGITTIDEPIADILGRFETAAIKRVQDEQQAADAAENDDFAALGEATSAEDFIRKSPNISWVGHITDNPAYGTALGDQYYEIRAFDAAAGKYDLDIHLDTYWDNDPDGGTSKHAVRDIVIPLIVEGAEPGRVPVVDRERLIPDVYAMLAATAGIGNTAITGDKLTEMPQLDGKTSDERPFATATAAYTLSANLGFDHEAATGAALPTTLQPSRIAPDALVGPAWPAIYTALGSVYVKGYPVIEGLLNAVHLDHLIELEVNEEDLLKHTGETITLKSWAEDYFESASGRVVTIHVTHTAADGTLLARETERFAIRGRVYSDALPAYAPEFGDADHEEIAPTPRRLLRRVKVVAPHDMTAFARTSGDFNPIHTSTRGARISGLAAPLVHGMWLSATAQHAVQALDEKGAHYEIAGWTYNMYGMVQLDDTVEISVERVGKVRHGGMTLEVTCRIDGQLVSRGTALVRAPRAAFVYPGQGIQKQGMVLDERAKSAAARDVWERADKLTRSKLGFSILGLVRDNPKELTANGVTYRHPEGLLNLTQFTQVALATVAFAQTARLREAGADIWPAYFAGHSLGEYNALSAFADVIPLETVLELVFHRGSTMHHLIERDAQGRSNYRMGALRPNQFGVDDAHVKEYVESVAKASGEFLEIVNYNLAGQQYAIAGTIAGLKALKADSARRVAAFGGKPAFMLVPGIDVPFHSTLLRKGVPEFRDKLDALLPAYIDYRGRLVDRYIPNLVATPFEMTKEFAAKILEVVPSERIKAVLDDPAVWDSYADDDQKLGRLLLTELLSWQFASPVRWIETQALLFGQREQGGLGVEEYVEVGLGNAPTLANLGAKTLRLPEFAGNDTVVYNVGRDEGRVYMTDTDSLVPDDEPEEAAASAPVETAPAGGSAVAKLGSGAAPANAVTEAAQTTDGSVAGRSTGLSDSSRGQQIKALPTPIVTKQAPVDLNDWTNVTAKPEDEIVIVSVGELGPWGSGRTRAQAELGIHSDGTVDLSAGAVLELAWNMGLLTWADSPKPGWYDTDGNLVPEEDIAERYHDEVVARSGIRPFEEGMGNDYKDGADEEEAEVFLDHDVTFSVPTREVATEYVKLDEAHTTIAPDEESGEWNVTRHAGSMIRVPRRATMTRTVGGQFPKGFDPTRWGIPASMVGDVDKIALWNIVTTVDAYLGAGFTPAEILESIHPSLVASTQGTGFGGMMSMRKLYLDRFLNHEIPTDILQEALPNVVAAHVMQSYIGGYGNMIQPVSACATAAVSLEEGVDKIALGKADFVVTGAIDDIGVESVIGFGNMNATANSEEMYGKGIDARFFSRANDRRRGGFLESQGGGTILVTRGDIAEKLGLPVAAVVGFIHSYADGAHTSIPAPGLGALAAGLGGKDSKLVHDLAKLGVSADDIAVVSKHDTSTNANDPNESELHNTLAHAIGRTDGNPLFVISQKTLTGHAKGGACIFQVNGLTQLFKSGVIPANAALDCVDPKLQRDDHMVWVRKPLRIGGGEDEFGRETAGRPVKAGLATSLGFGHVSGFVALVHPGAFEAAVAKADGEAALEAWRERANARLAAGQRHLEEGMMGRAALYEPIDNRRFREDHRGYDHHEVEKAMLLNPDARLGADGYYEA